MLQKKDKILEYFLEKPNSEFHLRELARLSSLSTTAVKERLNELEKRNIVSIEKKKHLTVFKSRITEEYKEAKRLHTIQKIRDSGLLKHILGEFRHPEAVVLFGSSARGEDTEKSDLDIFVLVSAKKDHDFSDFEKKLGKKINAIVMTQNEFAETKKRMPEFVNNVVNGVILEGYLKVL